MSNWEGISSHDEPWVKSRHRIMSLLYVTIEEHLVGHLEDRAGNLFFKYHEDWLEYPQHYGISKALPLSSSTHGPDATQPFFSGLLPEYGIRERVAANLGVSAGNDYQILKAIGRDCAGALCITPDAHPTTPANQLECLTVHQLGDLLEQLDVQPLLIGRKGIRLSLAGAQNKLPVIKQDDKIYLGQDGTPSTHIIKPENLHFQNLVRNEHFCLQLARHCGLDAIDSELLTLPNEEALIVPRYDRYIAEGVTRRIHQEDFCQALSISPTCKYEIEGGPSLVDSIDLIRHTSSVPARDTIKFIDTFFFNYLIGNRDAHGKNFSFLIDKKGVRLAPLYDLVCTEAYTNLDNTLAMSLGGVNNPIFIEPIHFSKACEGANLNTQLIKKRLRKLHQKVHMESEKMANDGIGKTILAIVNKNGRFLLDFIK